MSASAAIYCFLVVSCMTVDRRGFFLIDTPKAVKEHNIIEDKILPYIAEVLDYNNPSGVHDPEAAQRCRTIPTVNNMNYDEFVDCQDYALLFYALCKYYNIDCKLVGNPTLRHAYNQLNVRGHAVDVEPQNGEGTVYFVAQHSWEFSKNGLFIKRINTHPDNIVMNIDEWNAYGEEGRFVSPANMELFNYVVKNGHLPNQEMQKEYPMPDLLTGNGVLLLTPSIGYNHALYGVVDIPRYGADTSRYGADISRRKSHQFTFGINWLQVARPPTRWSYMIGADWAIGGKVAETLKYPFHKQWGEPYTAFSSVLSAHLLFGYTFNIKDFYLTPAGGIGLSASIFGKSSFISFTVPIDLDIKYYFTRSVGISISGMGTFGVGSFITSSEMPVNSMPVNSASAYFMRSVMVHPLSANFAIKIGPTIRIPGQKELTEEIRKLQNKRR